MTAPFASRLRRQGRQMTPACVTRAMPEAKPWRETTAGREDGGQRASVKYE
ncbi:MAG: hypothetical protein PVI53_17145 [Desulfobacteraceae bacterium]